MADRRPGQRRFLLLRWTDAVEPAILRVPLARRLPAGKRPAPRSAAVAGLTSSRERARLRAKLRGLAVLIIHRITRAADGTDRVGLLAAVERFAQATHVH